MDLVESTLSLTILGTIFAVYTVLPEHRKIKAISSFWKLEYLIITCLVLLILSTLILGIFVSFQTNNEIKSEQLVFELSYIIFNLILLLIIFYNFFLGKIKNNQYLSDKIDELLNGKKYATIFALLDENYDDIFKNNINEDLLNNNLDAFDLLYDQITKSEINNDYLHFKKENVNKTHLDKVKTFFSNLIDTNNTSFLENLEFRILNNQLIKELIIIRPNFGLKIINDNRFRLDFRERFANLFFSNLIINTESLLYFEICNINEKFRYDLDNTKILKNIFTDVKIAEEIKIYRPIGNSVLIILENQKSKEYDIYNEYNPRFIDDGDPDNELLYDPVLIGIKFFDIMIKESIFQRIDSHMWLYYFHYFVRQICQNYKNENANLSEEFSNIYSYFLFEIITKLINWIKMPLMNKDLILPIEILSCDGHDNNIIKDCIICLIQCHREILKSEYSVPLKDKKNLTKKIIKLYLDLVLNNEKEINNYGDLLLCCILDGKKDYINYIIRVHDNYDRASLRGSLAGRSDAFDNLKTKLEKRLAKK